MGLVLACTKREAAKDDPPVATAPAALVAPSTEASAAARAPHLCPAAGPCRVLPLGDSITFGVGGSPGGYRVPLFRIARTNGRDLTFVGRLRNGPPSVDDRAFPGGHEGNPGYTVEACRDRAGILPLVPGALAAARPHVVLLMIGTNDVAAGCDLAKSLAALERLVALVEGSTPEPTLVLANLVPSRDEAFDARATPYTAAISKLVAEHAARGKKVRLADTMAAFTAVPGYRAALLADALHPNDAGYAVMAGAWARAMDLTP